MRRCDIRHLEFQADCLSHGRLRKQAGVCVPFIPNASFFFSFLIYATTLSDLHYFERLLVLSRAKRRLRVLV